jgi:hypothetical protein
MAVTDYTGLMITDKSITCVILSKKNYIAKLMMGREVNVYMLWANSAWTTVSRWLMQSTGLVKTLLKTAFKPAF